MSIYDNLQAGVALMMQTLKSTVVTINRQTDSPQTPTEEYSSEAEEIDVYTASAAVFGVEEKYVDNETVLRNDVEIITEAFATKDGVRALFEHSAKDEYILDGKTHTVVKIERIPETGTAVAFIIIVRS